MRRKRTAAKKENITTTKPHLNIALALRARFNKIQVVPIVSAPIFFLLIPLYSYVIFLFIFIKHSKRAFREHVNVNPHFCFAKES